MSVINGITLGIALLGAVLGVINTWRLFDSDRVKLKVIPKYAHRGSLGGHKALCIEIVNQGFHSVTVDDIGIFYQNSTQRGSLIKPIIIDGGNFPRRLEPKSSFSVYGQPEQYLVDKSFPFTKCAYARTGCDEEFTGKSKALDQLILESIAHQKENFMEDVP